MKSYTDLEQSKKLGKILPIESADMCWTNHCYGNIRSSLTVSSKTIEEYKNLLTLFADLTDIDVFYPCWSLAALLSVMPKIGAEEPMIRKLYYVNEPRERYICGYSLTNITSEYDNPVDACYEMIVKFHKMNLL